MDLEFEDGRESEFRRGLTQALSKELQRCPSILAAWEGGSAANATSDRFSDIDLNILHADDESAVFQSVEATLRKISKITHIYNEPKSLWPDLTQKIYVLADAPKYFFLDVAAFPESKPELLEEFLQKERHGVPSVLFDREGCINCRPLEANALLQRQTRRLNEIVEAFPIYRSTVYKELDRGNAIDAFGFYYSGMLRPLIEVTGMIYRPYRFDFGFRYLKRSLPADLYRRVEPLFFVGNLALLQEHARSVDELFTQMVDEATIKFANKPV